MSWIGQSDAAHSRTIAEDEADDLPAAHDRLAAADHRAGR